MGVDLGNSDDNAPLSSINITPFVDVVLVLLVIFMITAPVLMKDVIGINLPKASTGDGKTGTTLGIAVTRQGQILLNGQLVAEEALRNEIQRTLQETPQVQAIISADTEARHGDVVRAIDIIKGAGLNRFALQVEHK